MNDPSAPTTAATPIAASPAAGAPARPSEGGIKDTIESILIAFILAFIFRAFVVEAFVIPTGSMAPTLMGAHMRMRCEDCGYGWAVNYSSAGDSDDMVIPKRANDNMHDRSGRPVDKVFALRCPNCGHRVPRQNSVDRDNAATNPPVFYGDRILVLKYLYLFHAPQRWDVVVFKAPAEPQRWDYSQNYIKRLVGRPGETVMILDGDIYVADAKDRNPDSLKPEDFTVQTKPRVAQEALWRIVYDNDFYPQGVSRVRTNRDGQTIGYDAAWKQPWTPIANESGWDLGAGPLNGRIFRFDNASGAATLTFNPDANPEQQSLTDWLAYDVTVKQGPNLLDTYNDPRVDDYKGDNNISDVKLNFFHKRVSGEGPLRVALTKLGRTFVARITPTQATLFERTSDGSETELQSAAIRDPGDRPMHVEFSNVDYRVTLRLDDRDVLQTTPQQYQPDVGSLLGAFARGEKQPKAGVEITAAQQKCEIAHLSLWRDVYYLNREPSFQATNLLRWAIPNAFPKNLITLGPTDYFVCGDNSAISGDARYWTADINLEHEDLHVLPGRVPDRFLLGKAFFVYWPAGFRPIDSAPALVPNFGQMRFIH